MDKVTEKVMKAALSHFVAKKEAAEADLTVILHRECTTTESVINKIEALNNAVSCIKTMGEILKDPGDDDNE